MKIYHLFIISISFSIVGCTSITVESATEGYKLKKEATLNGGLEENYKYAINHLPLCHKIFDKSVTKYLHKGNNVSSKRHTKPLIAIPSSGDGYKDLLLGNKVFGGLEYLKFTEVDNKTKLIGYSKAWYDSDLDIFIKYFNSIVSRDETICEKR